MSTSSRKIVLTTSDNQIFEIEENVAQLSLKFKKMNDNDNTKTSLLIPDINSRILSKVIDYCQKHVNNDNEDLKSFDDEFVNAVDSVTLLLLANAAKFLEINGLYDLCSDSLVDKMKDCRNVDEIREMLNIVDDLKPEEEAMLREVAPGAFDDA